jgi:hypothetical protein
MKTIGNRKQVMSALDYALEQTETVKRKDDEFTSSEFYNALIAKGVKISNSGAMYRLKEMVARRELVKRKTMINGATTNLYSKPSL